MKIVASQKLGELGPGQSSPVVIAWRWHDHAPWLPLLAPIVLALVLVRSNRNRQAWLILLPLMAVAIMWRLLARLFFMEPSSAETVAVFAVSMAAAWSVVWLLGDWLAGLRKLPAFLWAGALMLLMGGLSCVAHYGLASETRWPSWLGSYAVFTLILMAATALTAYRCRREYRPRRFLLWLLLWTPALSTPLALAFIIPFALVVGLTQGFPGLVAIVFVALMSMVFAALLLGVGLYLLNLPFVLLAVQCPLYGDRFRRVLRLPAATASEPGEAALGEAADGGEE